MHIVVAAYQLLLAKIAVPALVIHDLVFRASMKVLQMCRTLNNMIQDTAVATGSYFPIHRKFKVPERAGGDQRATIMFSAFRGPLALAVDHSVFGCPKWSY